MAPPTQPHPDAHISELVSLIKNATNIIQSHYLKSSLPTIPSLNNLAPHPLDSTISPPQLRDAAKLLEGACTQLCATLARPSHTILNIYEPACLRVVTTFKIPDILQEDPSGMHIKEIGERAGVNHEKLGRIMRLLATRHIFREVSDLPTFTDAFLTGQYSTGEHNKATAMIVEVLADPEWGNSQEIERFPWNKADKIQRLGVPVLDTQAQHQATPEGAKQEAHFGIGMHGWNDATQTAAVLAGIGNMAMELTKAYPNLHLKLQDLPDRIRQAETEVWPKLLPSAIAEKRIEFKAMDFFVDLPIEGCDVYYCSVPKDMWNEMIQLKLDTTGQIKNAYKFFATYAQFSSLVLASLSVCDLSEELLSTLTYQQWIENTDDYVLQHANHTDTSNSPFAEAPAPVLPNYGARQIRQYNLDVGMMIVHNCRERTLEDFMDIAGKADLQFVKLWPVGEMGMVEFQPA
ncbi:hypothetical protein C0995_010532 [Termitomyces sp. Mi166|nr:hypothetical protein C0995_010532 [Termitomyces sp. Mi166\